MLKDFISWDTIHFDCQKLTEKIICFNETYDLIVGFARGGLVPACIISHQLGNVPVVSISTSSYNKDDKQVERTIHQELQASCLSRKNVLFIDDLVDTGGTLEYFIKRYKMFNNIKIRSAVLYRKTNAKFVPDVYLKDIDSNVWIVFPWEKND